MRIWWSSLHEYSSSDVVQPTQLTSSFSDLLLKKDNYYGIYLTDNMAPKDSGIDKVIKRRLNSC